MQRGRQRRVNASASRAAPQRVALAPLLSLLAPARSCRREAAAFVGPELSRSELKINGAFWMLKPLSMFLAQPVSISNLLLFLASGGGRYQVITSSEWEDFGV